MGEWRGGRLETERRDGRRGGEQGLKGSRERGRKEGGGEAGEWVNPMSGDGQKRWEGGAEGVAGKVD